MYNTKKGQNSDNETKITDNKKGLWTLQHVQKLILDTEIIQPDT